jgi:glutathione S-transferase
MRDRLAVTVISCALVTRMEEKATIPASAIQVKRMDSIVLWGRRSAFNVQKVLWLLGELELEFHYEDVGGAHGRLDTPEFLRMNPHGRVPVLRDGSTVIWESHSILRYLAASYGSQALWPADPGKRSQADRWMDWSQTALQPAFMQLFWGYFRTPRALWDRAGLEPAIEACDIRFGLLDEQLARLPFLAGHELTLADIPAGTTLFRYFGMGVDVPRHPNVDAWYARLCAREAYRAAVMVSFDELRGRLAY